MKKKEVPSRGLAGGQALAKIPGYHALLAQRSHGQISKKEFAKKKIALLAKLTKKNGRKTGSSNSRVRKSR